MMAIRSTTRPTQQIRGSWTSSRQQPEDRAIASNRPRTSGSSTAEFRRPTRRPAFPTRISASPSVSKKIFLEGPTVRCVRHRKLRRMSVARRLDLAAQCSLKASPSWSSTAVVSAGHLHFVPLGDSRRERLGRAAGADAQVPRLPSHVRSRRAERSGRAGARLEDRGLPILPRHSG